MKVTALIILNFAKLHLPIQARTLLTWKSIIWKITNKRLLVEHRPIATDEAILGVAGNVPLVVLHRQADVEHLAVVVHVPVVAVCLTLTAETVIIGRGQEVLRPRRKTIPCVLVLIVLGDDQASQHATEDDGLHGEGLCADWCLLTTKDATSGALVLYTTHNNMGYGAGDARGMGGR